MCNLSIPFEIITLSAENSSLLLLGIRKLRWKTFLKNISSEKYLFKKDIWEGIYLKKYIHFKILIDF